MKPIIFSTPMVQAILDGRKTQTRRVVKINGYPITSPKESLELTKEGLIYHSFCSMSGYYKPLCQPGDILWVRETWADLRGMGFGHDPRTDKPFNFAYRADTKPGSDGDRIRKEYGIKWKPSIHMPREAARIFLQVTNVRVERLQDITEEDAMAEGVGDPYEYQSPEYYDQPHMRGLEINKSAFAGLWDSLSEKRGYGWRTNPWVWVIEFEVCDKTQTYRRAHEVLGR